MFKYYSFSVNYHIGGVFLGEFRDFYYLDNKLSDNYLAQIEDGLIKYKNENEIKNKPNHSFEISTGKLGELLSSVLGTPLPDLSYTREGKSEEITIEDFKISNETSRFSRLLKYLDPAMIDIKEEKNRDFWNKLSDNQFIKFNCELKLSNLYLFTDFTRRIGQPSIFNIEGENKDFDDYVKHSEIIESQKKHKIILKPDFSPNKDKYYFVSEFKKRFFDEDIELKDLNTVKLTVIGRIDKRIDISEKEIVFDLSEAGMVQMMGRKYIKEFINNFNKNNNNPIMKQFLISEQDIYATKPAMIFKPLALYKV